MTVTSTKREEAGADPPESDRVAASPCPRPAIRPAHEDANDRVLGIREVAELTGLSPDTLRWYESIGLLPRVSRSHTGQRRFTRRDLDWLDLVGKLRLTGMPVADMVRYTDLVRAGDSTVPERLDVMRATRERALARVAELREAVRVLDYKITVYEAAARSRGGPTDDP